MTQVGDAETERERELVEAETQVGDAEMERERELAEMES